MKTYQRKIKTIIYTKKFQHDRFVLGTYIALVAQWIERMFPKQKPEGSTPCYCELEKNITNLTRPCSFSVESKQPTTT